MGAIEPDTYIHMWDGKSRFQTTQIIKEFWGVALPTYAGIQGMSPRKIESIWVNCA
ncbi:MAG: hypothetical protein AAGG51_22195 [Cyanobacteria bacterium P01_G01_bin.54]